MRSLLLFNSLQALNLGRTSLCEFVKNKLLGQTADDMLTHANPKNLEYMPGGNRSRKGLPFCTHMASSIAQAFSSRLTTVGFSSTAILWPMRPLGFDLINRSH